MDKDYQEQSRRINKAYKKENDFLVDEVIDKGANSNLDEQIENGEHISEDEVVSNQKGSQLDSSQQ